MRVAVLGYGIEGQAAAAYWQAKGAEITVCDQTATLKLPKGVEGRLGDDYLKDLKGFDLVVRQQSIHPNKVKTDAPVTNVIAEFMEHCPVPIIGVTGTKGKGTTSSLITKILEAAGKKVWLGGNIGQVPLEFLGRIKPTDVVVLELSSSQLIDVKQSPATAVCLMVVPEHLNYHADIDEYMAAKANMFRYQKPEDVAIFKAGDARSRAIATTSPGRHIPFGERPGAYIEGDKIKMGEVTIIHTSEVGLIGPHNLENIMAAITATWELTGRNPEPTREAIKAFTGLEHRLELAGKAGGVRYYDDSFATTPETAIAALNAFPEPKVMILGGSNKGAAFDELAMAIQHGGVIHTFIIGDTAPSIEAALHRAGFTHITMGYTSMAKLVSDCAAITEPGDVVLLSPGCASFGLFKDYKDRGNQFKAEVAKL